MEGGRDKCNKDKKQRKLLVKYNVDNDYKEEDKSRFITLGKYVGQPEKFIVRN